MTGGVNMTLVYSDGSNVQKVDLDKTCNIVFFDGFLLATAYDGDFVKVKFDNIFGIKTEGDNDEK